MADTNTLREALGRLEEARRRSADDAVIEEIHRDIHRTLDDLIARTITGRTVWRSKNVNPTVDVARVR
jgi:hypothetical protein